MAHGVSTHPSVSVTFLLKLQTQTGEAASATCHVVSCSPAAA